MLKHLTIPDFQKGRQENVQTTESWLYWGTHILPTKDFSVRFQMDVNDALYLVIYNLKLLDRH